MGVRRQEVIAKKVSNFRSNPGRFRQRPGHFRKFSVSSKRLGLLNCFCLQLERPAGARYARPAMLGEEE
jgi:hypothetical protein